MKKEKQEILLNDARGWFLSEYGDTPEKVGYPYYCFGKSRMSWMELPSLIYASSKQVADEYIKETKVWASLWDCAVVAVFLFIVGCFGLFYLEKTALILAGSIILMLIFFIFVFLIIRTYARINRKYEKQIVVFHMR